MGLWVGTQEQSADTYLDQRQPSTRRLERPLSGAKQTLDW